MDIPTFFTDFLANIRPTATQREKMRDAHKDLKERLEHCKDLSSILVANFIQGSYRRHTGLIGTEEHQCDVDLVVVTKIPAATSPTSALDLFKPFLEKNYKGRYEPQGRSWCIKWSDEITLDLVPTSAPSEVNENFLRHFAVGFDLGDPMWDGGLRKSKDGSFDHYRHFTELTENYGTAKWKFEPLFIPDREAKVWTRTHPLAQIAWSLKKNDACSGHYTNVVRALKWWRRMMTPEPKHPRGYPLEHLVGICCPSGIGSVAEGVASCLEAIVVSYSKEIQANSKPILPDHGVPEHDVLKRISAEDFAGFYRNCNTAAEIATRARSAETIAKSANLWRSLFGSAFPTAPEEDKKLVPSVMVGGFNPPKAPAVPVGGRFA